MFYKDVEFVSVDDYSLIARPDLPQPRLFSVKEYYDMTEVGILKPDEKTELIEGEVVLMAAKDPPHVTSTKLIVSCFEELFKGKALVRSQDPIRLLPKSEPEPDVALVKGTDPRQYADQHPTARETFLIVEVADATLSQDLGKKATMYARSKILDYWVVDVNSQKFFVHRHPTQGKYPIIEVLTVEDAIAPLAFPDITIAIREFFP
jgi:Uma2 family endonuclease